MIAVRSSATAEDLPDASFAGEIVPSALKALDKGATLVLGGIHMSDIPQLEYKSLYDERVVRSVANNTREDGREFLNEAATIPIKTSVQPFGLEDANDALIALKNDAIESADVLVSRMMGGAGSLLYAVCSICVVS